MSIREMFWLAMGIVAGVTQAVALWRATHASRVQSWSAVWRLPAVAAVLVSAALGRSLLWAATGWAAGLIAASVAHLARRRPWM